MRDEHPRHKSDGQLSHLPSTNFHQSPIINTPQFVMGT